MVLLCTWNDDWSYLKQWITSIVFHETWILWCYFPTIITSLWQCAVFERQDSLPQRVRSSPWEFFLAFPPVLLLPEDRTPLLRFSWEKEMGGGLLSLPIFSWYFILSLNPLRDKIKCWKYKRWEIQYYAWLVRREHWDMLPSFPSAPNYMAHWCFKVSFELIFLNWLK